MTEMNSTTPLKQCSRKEKCTNPLGSYLPATHEFFNRDKNRADGLNPQCKSCTRKGVTKWFEEHVDYAKQYHREYYRRNQETIKERVRAYAQVNADSIRIKGKAFREKNRERLRERHRKYRYANLEADRLRSRNYRARNHEKIRERKHEKYWSDPESSRAMRRQRHEKNKLEVNARRREQYHANSQPFLIKQREYKNKNREAVKERTKKWIAKNPDRARVISIRYLDRKRKLRNEFSAEDWQRALRYWNGCCAVCGVSPGLWHKIAADHWIPVSRGGETIPSNIIPLCHTGKGGEGGCNNTKSGRNAAEWLEATFGKVKASGILTHVEAYFEWVRQQV